MVRSYLTAFASGIARPLSGPPTAHGWLDKFEIAGRLGSKHGRWIGRWLHGKPTRAMIYKIFVLWAGVLIGLGYVCNDQYYRPISGIMIGTIGLILFAIWGISEEDVR